MLNYLDGYALDAQFTHVGELFNEPFKSYKIRNYPVEPSPLSCIIFPSWLSHYVEPNMSDEKRISLSFNFDIKREIS